MVRRLFVETPAAAEIPTVQPTASELLTKLTQVGNTLDQLDFRQSPELTQAQAKKLLRARREINAQLEEIRRSPSHAN
jgi:hypothetical protein